MFIGIFLIICLILAIIEKFVGWSPLPDMGPSGQPYKKAPASYGVYVPDDQKITPRGGPTKHYDQPWFETPGQFFALLFWIAVAATPFVLVIGSIMNGWN